MELSNQVTTLEQSRRLKELGVECKPLFYHVYNYCGKNGHEVIYHTEKGAYALKSLTLGYEALFIPALTCSELGVALPACVHNLFGTPCNGVLVIQNKGGYWYVAYWGSSVKFYPKREIYREDESLATAMGAMLIHLLETGAITANEVNERLNK